MTILKTFIVEDSAVIRENLVAALEEMSPVTVVGTAVDEASASVWLRAHPAESDPVIIDISSKVGPVWACFEQLQS